MTIILNVYLLTFLVHCVELCRRGAGQRLGTKGWLQQDGRDVCGSQRIPSVQVHTMVVWHNAERRLPIHSAQVCQIS